MIYNLIKKKGSTIIFQTMNSINDIQRRKINTFLVADNMEDESQMDLAVHGELAGKIVEQIFDQVFLSSFHFSLSLSLSLSWIILSHAKHREFLIFLSFRNHQVQKNKDLKVSLGPGLYYKHKVRDTVTAEKCHQTFSNDKVRFFNLYNNLTSNI